MPCALLVQAHRTPRGQPLLGRVACDAHPLQRRVHHAPRALGGAVARGEVVQQLQERVRRLVMQRGQVRIGAERDGELGRIEGGADDLPALVQRLNIRILRRQKRLIPDHIVVRALALAPAVAVQVAQAGDAEGLQVFAGGFGGIAARHSVKHRAVTHHAFI